MAKNKKKKIIITKKKKQKIDLYGVAEEEFLTVLDNISRRLANKF